MPRHPKDGTFIRGWAAGAATGPTYEIVGGAPITVHAWANLGKTSATVEKVDAASIPKVGAAPVTKNGANALQGYINANPAANTAFRGHATRQYYKLDASLHVVPQAAAAPATAIDVDQTSINACERMLCDPNGEIETGTSGYGVLHVEGFAMDYPAATPVSVQLVIDQRLTDTLTANQSNAYQPPGVAGSHGFAADVYVGAGVHEVCATVIGTTPGATTQALGCSYPTLNGAKPGKMKKPKLKARGHGKVKVRWKLVATNGNPITGYRLKCAGMHQKQISGAKLSHTLKHLGRGRKLTCKIRAISGGSTGGYGPWSKKSKTVTVR